MSVARDALVVPCPKCGRRLRLPVELRGTLVGCPACRHAFTAPLPETPTLVLPDVSPTSELSLDLAAQFDRAAAWLKAAFLLQVALVATWGTCCSCAAQEVIPPHFHAAYLLLFPGGLVLLGLSLAGVRSFLSLTSYAWAIVGLVVLTCTALLALLDTILLGVFYSEVLADYLGTTRYRGLCFEVFLLGLPGLTAVVGLIAGWRSLVLLHRREVMQEFRRRGGKL